MYRIDVFTDATALAQKVAASPDGASPAELESLLRNHDERFRQGIQIAFDAARTGIGTP